jgi:type II secretory pathway component GspD/PulD (secretin)
MKILLTFALLMGTVVTANAATPGYELMMDLALGGKVVSHPQVKVQANHMATVSQKDGNRETFIDVTASEGKVQGHEGILMKFVIGTMDQNGKRTVVSEPSLLVKENSPATLSVKGKELGQALKLSVTAKRTTF